MLRHTYFTPPFEKRSHIVLHKIGRSACRPSDVCTISFDPFVWKLPNLVQWIPSEEDEHYWFSCHMVKGQGQTAGLWEMLATQYFLTLSWLFLDWSFYGMVWFICGLALFFHGMVFLWYGMVFLWHGFSMVWYSFLWYGMFFYGMVWFFYGMALLWYGLVFLWYGFSLI